MGQETERSIEDIIAELNELSARIDAATYRQLVLIGELDGLCDWEDMGCRSCAHFLSYSIGLDLGAARERVRVAHALKDLPKIADALRRGVTSYSKARALTRVATETTETELLNIAECGTASHGEKVVRLYRYTKKLEAPQLTKQLIQKRELSYYFDDDGMLVLKARLTPDRGAVFVKALEACESDLFAKEKGNEPQNPGQEDFPAPRTIKPQRQADALEVVCNAALEGGGVVPSGSASAQVIVHVDAEVLQTNSTALGRNEVEGGMGGRVALGVTSQGSLRSVRARLTHTAPQATGLLA